MVVALLDPGSFFGGVVVAVVGGLVLAFVLGVPRLLANQRKQKREAETSERERRTPIRVGAHIVASELRESAEIAERCHGGLHVPSEAAKLSLNEWQARRGEMLPLRDENADLWTTLGAAYEALARSKRDGAYPPSASELRDLADRLDAAGGP